MAWAWAPTVTALEAERPESVMAVTRPLTGRSAAFWMTTVCSARPVAAPVAVPAAQYQVELSVPGPGATGMN